MKPGRNDPCPCGSGKKYKHCCERTGASRPVITPPTLSEFNQLIALFNSGHLIEVESQTRLLTEQFPQLAVAWKLLGACLHRQGKGQDALPALLKAAKMLPNDAEAHYNLGVTQESLEHYKEAVASYRKSLILKPDSTAALNNLSNVLRTLGQFDDAVTSCRRALEINPNYAGAYHNLGNIMNDSGQIDEAVANYHRALEINPNFSEAHSNLLFCLNHSETVDAQTLFSEHLRFAQQFEAPLRANWPQHSNSRNPERCLQVGFVSGDLRKHAVAHFLEPVLAHLARHPQLSLHAYYNHAVEDNDSLRLKGYFKHWHSIAGLSDDALAQKIRADGIDILYDLAGHTAKNRLLTFARKPAPLQVSWIGYPCTTGLSAMDYFQSDRFLLPAGQFDDQFTEKIVCLPASSAFLPNKNAPPVNALPALSNGYITFGSFNRSSKISRSVVALWSQLLRALPDSRMLLGAMPVDGKYQTLIEWFAQENITQDRLIFHMRSDMDRYLNLHHQVDICLDTFPYNGGTTTFHALWMGVPTLALAGHTVAGWAGVSILGHVGLESFAAQNADDFVQKGGSWAGNLAALSNIRAELRERFAKSARGQPEVVAVGMELALRIMWQRWCAGLPAESYDVSLQEVNDILCDANK
jgi:predicted O-linked N-acetylglucosamine transferase (SPINDLY family)